MKQTGLFWKAVLDWRQTASIQILSPPCSCCDPLDKRLASPCLNFLYKGDTSSTYFTGLNELIYAKCIHALAITVVVITTEHWKGSEIGGPKNFWRLWCEVGLKGGGWVKSLHKNIQICNNPSPSQHSKVMIPLPPQQQEGLFLGDAALELLDSRTPGTAEKRGFD